MVFDRTAWRTDQPGPSVHGPLALPHNGWIGTSKEVVAPGCIIVRQRQPWRVLEVNERPEDLWPERWETAWQRRVAAREKYEAERLAGATDAYGLPCKPRPPMVRAEWPWRPAVIVLQPVDQPKSRPRHVMTAVNYQWQILPEHYSVCRVCGELPPCRHAETEATVEEAMADTERLMAIPRGACLGCGKTVTSRMKSTRFPGPNLWRPDWGNDTAVFHLRDQDRDLSCTGAYNRYHQQWEAAGLNNLNAQPTLPGSEH